MPYGHDSIQYGTDSGTESVDCAMNTWHSDKMEGICADDVEGLLEQFLQYERQGKGKAWGGLINSVTSPVYADVYHFSSFV